MPRFISDSFRQNDRQSLLGVTGNLFPVVNLEDVKHQTDQILDSGTSPISHFYGKRWIVKSTSPFENGGVFTNGWNGFNFSNYTPKINDIIECIFMNSDGINGYYEVVVSNDYEGISSKRTFDHDGLIIYDKSTNYHYLFKGASSNWNWAQIDFEAIGTQGPTGPQGEIGDQGPTGPTGSSVDVLVGYDYNENPPEEKAPGLIYDYWLNYTTGELFQDVGGSWEGFSVEVGTFYNGTETNTLYYASGPTNFVSLKGTQGPTGPQGDIGVQGPTGSISNIVVDSTTYSNVQSLNFVSGDNVFISKQTDGSGLTLTIGAQGNIEFSIGSSAPQKAKVGDKWFNTVLGAELTYLPNVPDQIGGTPDNFWVMVNSLAQADTKELLILGPDPGDQFTLGFSTESSNNELTFSGTKRINVTLNGTSREVIIDANLANTFTASNDEIPSVSFVRDNFLSTTNTDYATMFVALNMTGNNINNGVLDAGEF